MATSNITSNDVFHHDIKRPTGHLEKILVFASFGAFILGIIILHCYLKRQQLKSEKEHRDFLEENDRKAAQRLRREANRKESTECMEKPNELRGEERQSLVMPMFCEYDVDDTKQLVMAEWEVY